MHFMLLKIIFLYERKKEKIMFLHQFDVNQNNTFWNIKGFDSTNYISLNKGNG